MTIILPYLTGCAFIKKNLNSILYYARLFCYNNKPDKPISILAEYQKTEGKIAPWSAVSLHNAL